MKITIISDIHDNIPNLEKCLDWCREKNIDELICCGDITGKETLKSLNYNFNGITHLVKGNVNLYDESQVAQYKNIKNYGRIGRFKLDGKMVGICHEPYLADYILKQGPCDIIFYGHTHKPWQEMRDKTNLINPGTLGGVLQKATFAFWDTENGKLELKLLERL